MRFMIGLIGVLTLVVPVYAGPTPVPVVYDVEARWMALPNGPDPASDAPGTTYNACLTWQALRPDSGEAIGGSVPEFRCEPGDLRRYFRLEKHAFLLGEPILVEYRVELAGAGTWSEGQGGNYRARDRDDNFYFLIQREDGSWVDEVQPLRGLDGGGIGGGRAVTRESSVSDWQAVQRWCAITAPGRYELHCFYRPMDYTWPDLESDVVKALAPPEILQTHRVDERGRLINSATGEASRRYFVAKDRRQRTPGDTPLLEQMPNGVRALLDLDADALVTTLHADRATAQSVLRERQQAIRSAQVYARFPIEIRTGTEDERSRMVADWVQVAEGALGAEPSRRNQAALEAVHLSLSEDFLPVLERWLVQDTYRAGTLRQGLLLMGHLRATAALLDTEGGMGNPLNTSYELGAPLSPTQRRDLLRNLIAILADPDGGRRQRALTMLRSAAGGWFLGDKDRALAEPSREQLIEVQAAWNAWLDRQPMEMPTFTGGLWGYINREGVFVIEPQFTSAESFRDGVAKVMVGYEVRHIDASGGDVGARSEPQGEGPYRFQDGDRWGYKSAAGEVVIAPQYEAATSFRHGRALVRSGRTRLILDSAGRVVAGADCGVQSLHRDGYIEFSVPVPDGERRGLLDPDGHEILPPRYVSIGEFVDGLASIQVREESGEYHWGFADRSGKVLIKPEFDMVSSFSEGLAAAKPVSESERNWGYIDTKGSWVIEPRFRYAGSFKDGLAAVCADGKHGFLDRTGSWVIPAQYAWANGFAEGLAAVKVASPYRLLEQP